MYGYIYMTIDLIENKRYIGRHKSKYYDETYFGSGVIIRNILKSRPNSLINGIICECENEEELNNYEKKYIKEFDTRWPNGYNLDNGGRGHTHSMSTREAISNALKGHTPWIKGKKLTEEQRKRVSIGVNRALKEGKMQNIDRKKSWTKEKRLIQSAKHKGLVPWNKGKKLSDDIKERVSDGLKKYYQENPITEEFRKKISLSHLGRKHSEEWKRNQSIGLMGHIITEETKEKISVTNTKVAADRRKFYHDNYKHIFELEEVKNFAFTHINKRVTKNELVEFLIKFMNKQDKEILKNFTLSCFTTYFNENYNINTCR